MHLNETGEPLPKMKPWRLELTIATLLIFHILANVVVAKLVAHSDSFLRFYFDGTGFWIQCATTAIVSFTILFVSDECPALKVWARDNHLVPLAPRSFWHAVLIGVVLFYVLNAVAYSGHQAPDLRPKWSVLFDGPNAIPVAFPIVEEITMRGYVYSAAKMRWGTPNAIIVTVILDSAIHYRVFLIGPWNGAVIVIMVFVYSLYRECTNSVWPGMMCHISYNTLTVLSFGRWFPPVA